MIPGAIDAGIVNPVFWIGMTVALAAELEEDDTRPAHGSSCHRSVHVTPVTGMIGHLGPLQT